MTNRLNEIRNRTVLVTEGRWLTVEQQPADEWYGNSSASSEYQLKYADGTGRVFRIATFDGWDNRQADCLFVSHAKDDITWLIERVEERQAVLASLSRLLDDKAIRVVLSEVLGCDGQNENWQVILRAIEMGKKDV